MNDGGPIATASGLVFIGATTDFGFRAFDAKTGKELWKATLDNDVLMTPLTYQGANGKQYVAAVAGGGDAAFHIPAQPSPAGNATVVAFALPVSRRGHHGPTRILSDERHRHARRQGPGRRARSRAAQAPAAAPPRRSRRRAGAAPA